MDPDGRYVILNQSQYDRTLNFVKSENAKSFYFGSGIEGYIPSGNYFSDLQSAAPQPALVQKATSKFNYGRSSHFDNLEYGNSNKLSMNGNLELGFNYIEYCKKNDKDSTIKVVALISNEKDGKVSIDVRIKNGSENFQGTVAFAGLSEVQTDGKYDKEKIDKIANDSINFLRGYDYETKNLTE